MRMSHLASIAFACSISLFSTASFAQQSSNAVLCDDLHGATPSLYGLCIAYWATQESGNSDASIKILGKYTQRQGPGDPSMPGLEECPCWDAYGLTEGESVIPEGAAICFENTDSINTATGWYTTSGYSMQAYRGDGEGDPSTCSNHLAYNLSISGLVVTPDEYLSCYYDALASAERVGCSEATNPE